MIEHHGGEIDRRRGTTAAPAGCGCNAKQFVLVCWDRAVRGETFDGERTGDPDPRAVLVRAIIQEFDFRTARNGGVDAALPLDARGPPGGVVARRFGGPSRVGFTRDLPLFPRSGKYPVESGAQWL